jgi:hypothetical protein
MPVEASETGSDDTAKVQERLFIDLISGKQFGVVAKVVEEPTEFPESAFGAVEAPREGKCFMGGGLKDAEAQSKEGLLGMPAIGGPFNPNKEEPVEITDQILLSRMQARNVPLHDLASTVG